MTKLIRLIKNELKKIVFRKVTIVMVVLLAVIALGYSLLQGGLGAIVLDDLFLPTESPEEYCESQIEYYRKELEKIDQYENPEAAKAEFLLEIEAHTIMLNAGFAWDDWRYEQNLPYLAAEAKLMGDSVQYTTLMRIIEENDEVAFFEEQKRTFLLAFANDATRTAAYSKMMEYCIEHEVTPSMSDWRFERVQSYLTNFETVLEQEALIENGFSHNPSTLESARNEAAIALYQLENEIRVNPADSFSNNLFAMFEKPTSLFWDILSGSSGLISLVGMFLIIFAGGTVANEFTSGTIKFLLIAPVKRWKILLSKYAACTLICLPMILILFLCTLFPALLFGASELALPVLEAKGGEVVTYSPFLLLLRDYGSALVSALVLMTLSFALSALFRNSALAVGIGIFSYLSGSVVNLIFSGLNLDIGRYLLFANLDPVAIAQGNGAFPHQSLVTAIIVLVLHMAVFLLTAWDAFVKREV